MTKLVGYRKFVSKKNGETYCVANVVQDLTDREKENGCVGQKTDEIFMPKEQVNLLKPSDIGKEMSFNYELSGGRAFLVNVSLK